MRIFIAGGTGVIGRRVVGLLVDAGHQVTAVARSEAKARLLSELGATPARVDLFDPSSLEEAVSGHEAVFNLATAIPPGVSAMKKSAWEANHRIRREASANLVSAAKKAGVQRFIQESITLLYADGGEGWLDEDAPLSPTWVSASAYEAEQNVRRFGEDGRMAVVLRFAGFYGPDSGHTVDMIAAAQQGKAWAMGAKSAYTSSITTDDAAAAAVAALDAPSGVYNISDDEPLRRVDFFAALGDAVGQQRLRYPPAFLGRLAGPKLAMMLRSQRVSNQRFKEATGWRPRQASARDGWSAVVAEAGRTTAETGAADSAGHLALRRLVGQA